MECSSVLLILSILVAAAHCEVATITPCQGVPTDQCTVSEVRIVPCKFSIGMCAFKTGINSSLSFDFTPNFSADKLKTMVYFRDMPFAGLNTDDACSVTTCPAVAGRQQTLDYTLPIGKKLPLGRYKIHWHLWNADDVNQKCCFATQIRLQKK